MTAGCWVASSIFFAQAGQRIGALSLNVIRLTIAVLLLAVLALLLDGRLVPAVPSSRALLWLMGSGIAGLLIGDFLLFRALIEIGPRLSTLIMASVPLWVALFTIVLLGEDLAWRDLVGIAAVLGGIAWAITSRAAPVRATDEPAMPAEDPPSAPATAKSGEAARRPLPSSPGGVTMTGVLFATGGAIGQASGLMMSKVGMQEVPPLGATQIRIATGLVGFVLVCTVLNWWPRVRDAIRDPAALRFAGAGAFFGPFIGVWFSLLAIQTASHPAVAAALMATTPILMLPVSVARGESLSLGAIAGAALGVGGAALLLL